MKLPNMGRNGRRGGLVRTPVPQRIATYVTDGTVVFWALGGRDGWVLGWFKRWGHGVKVGRYAAAVTVCNGFMQSATLSGERWGFW